MPKKLGPERAHFGGEFGLITETREDGKTRYYWRCVHCNYHIGGKVFPNIKARIHLSGDPQLRSGIISVVCPKAPEEVQKKFRAIIAKKAEEKEQRIVKRKRARELSNANFSPSPAKQSKLYLGRHARVNLLDDDQVDQAWGRAFFTLDIALNKVDQEFFREAIAATKLSKPK
jgi:hypothetical protein